MASVAASLLLVLATATASAQDRPPAPGGGWTVVHRASADLTGIEASADRVVVRAGPRAFVGTGRRWRSIPAPPASPTGTLEGPPCEASGRATAVRAAEDVWYARCPNEVMWRRTAGTWSRWASMAHTEAVIVAAIELDSDRAVLAMADGSTFVLYGIRFRREGTNLRLRGFARRGDFVYAMTRRAILRRAVPPPTATYCQVRVEALLSAEAYTGSGPASPSDAALRSDPRWEEEEPGESHIQCLFRIELRGRAYSHLHVVSTTGSNPNPREHCESILPQVARHVRQFTDQCVDLSAGEYFGYRLVPLGIPENRQGI